MKDVPGEVLTVCGATYTWYFPGKPDKKEVSFVYDVRPAVWNYLAADAERVKGSQDVVRNNEEEKPVERGELNVLP